MRRLYLYITFLMYFVLNAKAQTPFDLFAPDVSRPMLQLEPETLKDTVSGKTISNLQKEQIKDDIRKWLSVDPLADKYPNISPYAYCGWNPINAIDPDGREEWELDVNTGKFQNIGNKGGSVTDYYSVGTYDGDKFSSYSDYVIERGDGAINSFRIQETDKSTTSAFHIPEINTSGFFLERQGPDTEESGQSLRIPAGQYGLHENSGSHYPNSPRLYNPIEGIGGKFDIRGILIHPGNYPKNSEGCLLPGSSYAPDFVGNSGNTLKNIMNYIVSTGWNCKLNIYNALKQR